MYPFLYPFFVPLVNNGCSHNGLSWQLLVMDDDRVLYTSTERAPTRTPSFYSLFNPFQIVRDVFFREAQRSTCAITGQPFTPNLTHHCRAGDATTKLPDILNGVLRSPALQRRASLHLLRYLLFHTYRSPPFVGG